MARISKMARRMTEAEFVHAVTPFSRLSAKAVAVAKAVLVDGQTVETVAVDHGASRQLVYKWATQVYESFRPEGWITEPITLPPRLDGPSCTRWKSSRARHGPTRCRRQKPAGAEQVLAVDTGRP